MIDSRIKLAHALAGLRVGLTVSEIVERSNKSDRAIRRWLQWIADELPQAELVRTREHSGAPYRYLLRGNRRMGNRPMIYQRITTDELATLDSVIRFLEDQNMTPKFNLLGRLRNKLLDLLSDRQLDNYECNRHEISRAGAWAPPPGPRIFVSEIIEETIKDAIRDRNLIQFTYSRGRGNNTHVVAPAGFLYSTWLSLVAWPRAAIGQNPAAFRLDQLSDVNVLNEGFERPAGFDLQDYADETVAGDRGEMRTVVLKFSPDVASDARIWRFHRGQTMEPQPDGSVIIQFRAHGGVELCNHLFGWGEDVAIIEPFSLRETYIALLNEALSAQTRG